MGFMDSVGDYADAVVAYVKSKTVYVIRHAVAAAIVFFLLIWKDVASFDAAFAALLCLCFWEMGQARAEVDGTDGPSKWLAMIKQFFSPAKLAQWLVPAAVPYILAVFF